MSKKIQIEILLFVIGVKKKKKTVWKMQVYKSYTASTLYIIIKTIVLYFFRCILNVCV